MQSCIHWKLQWMCTPSSQEKLIINGEKKKETTSLFRFERIEKALKVFRLVFRQLKKKKREKIKSQFSLKFNYEYQSQTFLMTTWYQVWTVWPPDLLVLTPDFLFLCLRKSGMSGRHGQWPVRLHFPPLPVKMKRKEKLTSWWNRGQLNAIPRAPLPFCKGTLSFLFMQHSLSPCQQGKLEEK